MESKKIDGYRPSAVRQLELDVAALEFERHRLTRKQVRDGLRKLRSTQTATVKAILLDYKAGKITRDAALKEFSEKTSTVFGRSRLLGYLSVGVPTALEPRDAASVARAVSEEATFFGRFLDDYRDGSGRMTLDQRAGMYGHTVDHQFHTGSVVAQPSDVAIYWRLTPAEHCKDCLALAAGSPYSKPGTGGNPLKTVPRSGHTECLSNCKCHLEFKSGLAGKPVRMEEPGYDITNFQGDPVTASVRASPGYSELDQRVQEIARGLIYSRRMLALAPDKATRGYYSQMRRKLNRELIALQEQTNSRFVPRYSVKETLEPVRQARTDGWRAVMDLRPSEQVLPSKKVVPPALVKQGQEAAVLDGFAWKVGKVRLVGGAQIAVSLPTGEVVTANVGDLDDLIVFVGGADEAQRTSP